MQQFYHIAGLSVAMDSFGRTVAQAAPYLTESVNKVDIKIQSSWSIRKKDYPMVSDDEGEYLATGANFYKQLLDFNGLMLHSSAVVVDGRAYLFSADSGTGKSTHTQLWIKELADRAFILNDDKPALRLKNGVWYAYGTPWSGKNDISINAGYPIAGIAMIERAEYNSIVLLNEKDAVLSVYRQVNHPTATEYRIKLLELLDKLIRQVPVWKLKCNMETEAAHLSYSAMSKNSSRATLGD